MLRLSSLIVRKTFRARSHRNVQFQLPTRIIPYVIEMTDKTNITLDHVYSMCTTMMETEAATLAVQMVLVLIRFVKLKRK
jgi:hypothetical protein